MRVYVAGASKEPERVRRAMSAVLAAGCELALDWLAVIEAVGLSNEGLTDAQRIAASGVDLDAVEDADLVWVLAPESQSAGCWVELGYALAGGKMVIVSGPARTRCIFASLAVEFETDDHAIAYLREEPADA
jgi:nucleoside 2-deoxyribosyltransferase